MKLYRIRWSSVLLFLLAVTVAGSCTKDDADPVATSQGLYINEVYAAGDDWIELYNDLDIKMDLTSYAIYDDVTHKYRLPAGTTIPARGFLILNCNDEGAGLNTSFKLTSSGETVNLENSVGVLIDKVEFPAIDNGQSFARFPDGSPVLAITGNTTKGITNGTSQAPAVVRVNRTPLVPSIIQSVLIEVELVSNINIASVKLFYRMGGASFTIVNMTLSGSLYQAVIPAANATGKMEYYVEVKGTNDKVSYSPSQAPDKTHSYLLNTDPLPQLVINEFMAFNSSCCPDNASGTPEFDDWIEIYNKGASDVNIAGMYLSDDKNDPFRHKIPSDNPALTTIPAGGYLVIWADNTQSQGPLHVEFALASAGEDVALFYIDGRTIDAYTFGAQNENVSTGRTTDGATTWKIFTTPTQGKANQ